MKKNKMQRNRIVAGAIAGILVLSMVIGLITPFLY